MKSLLDIDYARCPVDYMTDAVRRYVENGRQPGHFLTALLSNDLFESVARADADNARALREWVRFIYAELPHGSWGSKEAVREWIRHGGSGHHTDEDEAR